MVVSLGDRDILEDESIFLTK